jgi:excisionase family DNA binding protein
LGSLPVCAEQESDLATLLAKAIKALEAKLKASDQGPETDWLKVPNCAAALNVCNKTIYQAISDGKLRAARIGNGRGALRVHRSWIRDYAESMAEPVEIRK